MSFFYINCDKSDYLPPIYGISNTDIKNPLQKNIELPQQTAQSKYEEKNTQYSPYLSQPKLEVEHQRLYTDQDMEAIKSQLNESISYGRSLEGELNEKHNEIETIREDLRETKILLEQSERNFNEKILDYNQNYVSVTSTEDQISNKLKNFSAALNLVTNSEEFIIEKIENMKRDNLNLQRDLASSKRQLLLLESEQRANKETIIRLAGESETSHLNASQHFNLLQQASKDKEFLENELSSLKKKFVIFETEQEKLNMKLNHSEALRFNLLNKLKSKLKIDYEISDCINCEKDILDKIADLFDQQERNSNSFDSLHRKIESYQKEKEMENITHQNLNTAHKRIKHLEKDLKNIETKNEEYLGKIQEYKNFINEILQILNIENELKNMSFDFTRKCLLDQLEKRLGKESSQTAEMRSLNASLQKKIKNFDEYKNTKEGQVDLLKKKLSSLENILKEQHADQRERDEEIEKNKKMMKLLEKYKREVEEANLVIKDLKLRINSSCEIQKESITKTQTIMELHQKVKHLETQLSDQSYKMESQSVVLRSEAQRIKDKEETELKRIEALRIELATTKSQLESSIRNEKQLLELRSVLCQMLGLDVNRLAVPDYELVTRLEQLVLVSRTQNATACVLDSTIRDMSDAFKAGYAEAGRSKSSVNILGINNSGCKYANPVRLCKPLHN